MEDIKDQFLNANKAKDFIGSVEDPVVREALWRAFQTVTFQMAPADVDGEFDLHFFMNVLSELFQDRVEFGKLLIGDSSFTDD